MTKGDFLAAYNIGHRDGKEDVYCPNDYDDIFNIGQQPNECEYCHEDSDGYVKPLEKNKQGVSDVLDKIKTEIERRCCITVGEGEEPAITLYDVFQIIDKYKKESEAAECNAIRNTLYRQ